MNNPNKEQEKFEETQNGGGKESTSSEQKSELPIKLLIILASVTFIALALILLLN